MISNFVSVVSGCVVGGWLGGLTLMGIFSLLQILMCEKEIHKMCVAISVFYNLW